MQESLERLFAGHAEKLQFPGVSTIYTVPPYLKVRYPGLSAEYAPGGLEVLHTVALHSRGDRDQVRHEAIDALIELVAKRGDWERLLGDREALERFVLASGGHLRDLLPDRW